MSKTYRELILDLENAVKREANLQDWPPAIFRKQLLRVEHLRTTLRDHLDEVPTSKDADLVILFKEVARRVNASMS